MTRLLLCSLLGVVAVGCARLDISDYRRPYACVANRDGGLDGGRQCLPGWSCGYDDRCFDRVLDGGQRPAEWRCADDSQCPNAWRCGQLVADQRFCQELDAGAPSPCSSDEGCQGGWRCGVGERCFDPKDARDAGVRGCTTDLQCPDDFRCGEEVPQRPQLCIPRGVGTEAWCLSDLGCEGRYRCDLAAQRCVDVTDALATGQAGPLVVRRLNPRHEGEAPPLHFAVTSYSQIRLQPFGVNSGADTVSGVLMAAVLPDGGYRVTAQPQDEQRADDGRQLAVFELELSHDAGRRVEELAVGPAGPVVRYEDGQTWLYNLDGGAWQLLGACSLLRQRDALDERGQSDVARVCGGEIKADDEKLLDAGALELVPTRERTYFFTPDQRLVFWDGGTWVELRKPDAGALVPGSPRAIAAAWTVPAGVRDPLLGVVSTLRTDAGLTELSVSMVQFRGSNQPPQLDPNSGRTFAPCPDGAAPLQVSIAEDPSRRPAVRARCPSRDGGSYPVEVALFEELFVAQPAIEDPVPFQGPFVAQRTSPFVRGHAGAHGRAWHTQYSDGGLAVGAQTLRALVLDRQPVSLITYRDPRFTERRVFALSNGRVFSDDARGGLIGQLKDPEGTPLSTVEGIDGVLLAREGLLTTASGQPRLLATLPGGARFDAPSLGVLATLRLEGEDRKIVLVSSSDSLFAADVTEGLASAFAQPAVFSRVLVPVPGVALRSMTLGPADAGLVGYLTTNTQNLRFATEDLVRWSLTPVATPAMGSNALPLGVWSEPNGGAARTTFSDGRVWSLPVMVPLTRPLTGPDGGVLTAVDAARLCGEVFVASEAGVFRLARAGAADGGLPGWEPVADLEGKLDSTRGLRLYASRDSEQRLFVATRSGQLFEVTASTPCR